jgi:hypothetical protein
MHQRPAATKPVIEDQDYLSPYPRNPREHVGELVVGHQAREIDLNAAVIEENLAANGGWHQ